MRPGAIVSPHTVMGTFARYTLNIGGRLADLSEPAVMGILNVTPDSFYGASRVSDGESAARRARQILAEGGTIIDVGACSTRPGFTDAGEEEETARLRMALPAVRRAAPDAAVSVDTFRASVARMCVEEYGADIINDVSGGEADREMFATVAGLGVPYVLTHPGGAPAAGRDMGAEGYVAGVAAFLAERLARLNAMGVKDVIIDPGFGFGKTLEQNYWILRYLEGFKELGSPLLVGVSRKSMIYRPLGTSPEGALNGTAACHAIALMKGADILRAHDVKACREAAKIARLAAGGAAGVW